MATDPADKAAPVVHGPRKWPRKQSGLRQFAEVFLYLGLFALLKKLNSDGILLPGLSKWQFVGVTLGSIAALAGIGHLVSRRLAARRGEPPKS